MKIADYGDWRIAKLSDAKARCFARTSARDLPNQTAPGTRPMYQLNFNALLSIQQHAHTIRGLEMFIVFEGIDGSGKTSLCKLVFDRLKELQIISRITSELGRGEDWSINGREKLLAARNQQEELHVIMGTRCTHQENVLSPYLREGCVVLMDRYLMSTIAYQSNASISPGWLIHQHKLLSLPMPDKVFYLRIPVDVAMQRLRNRGEKNRIDERPESFFIKASEAYEQSIPLLTAEGWDIEKLDATAPLAGLVDEVVKQVVSMCREAA